MTPLDHNDVRDALRPRLFDWLLAGLVIVLLGLANFASGQHYDATERQSEHAELGIYGGKVAPMVVLFETDLFSDGWHLTRHYADRDMPNGKKWIKKLQDNPGANVLLNWEKYLREKGFNEYRADVLRYVQAYDKQNREYWFYGMPYDPRGSFESSAAKAFSYAERAKENPLMDLCTGYAAQCYYYHDDPGSEKYELRCKYRQFIAGLSGRRCKAVYWGRTPPSKNQPQRSYKAIPADRILRDLAMLRETYEGVIIWDHPPYYSEGKPIDAANRLLALEALK